MPEIIVPACFGRYLRYAIDTDFAYFGFLADRALRLSLLVELKPGKSSAAFASALSAAADVDVDVGPFPVKRLDEKTAPDEAEAGGAPPGPRFITVRALRPAVAPDPQRREAVFAVWNELVEAVQLSMPVQPRAELTVARLLNNDRARSDSTVMIGLIDDGCPFASARFLAGSGASRVLALWDQNQQNAGAIDVGGQRRFGMAVTDFNYGLEFWRKVQPPPAQDPQQIGINDWIARFRAPAGSIVEDACYAGVGLKSLRGAISHGGHVMDLLAGRVPPSSRVSMDGVSAPTWAVATDDACAADIVFVQIPESGVKDATGIWLDTHAVDGVRYILSCANPATTRHVVVNISYGRTTGPHDGTAELEGALRELVEEYDGTSGKPKLYIVLAAGNAYLSEGHVFFESPRANGQAEWVWRIPPDNTVPCFAEVWIDTAQATGVQVVLSPPADAAGPSYGLQMETQGNNTVWLFVVPPTIAKPPGTPAPDGTVYAPTAHGDWKLTVSGVAANTLVHAYVARTDPNMGARTGARSSRFIDARWERDDAARASQMRANGEFDKTGSLVRRGGTINGIATNAPSVSRIHVAGGDVNGDVFGSRYSSAGPARGGGRLGPDVALLCDESYALRGIRAGANRSGGVLRLIGTSTAAPQLARHVANGLIPQPTSPGNTAKRGAGKVRPP